MTSTTNSGKSGRTARPWARGFLSLPPAASASKAERRQEALAGPGTPRRQVSAWAPAPDPGEHPPPGRVPSTPRLRAATEPRTSRPAAVPTMAAGIQPPRSSLRHSRREVRLLPWPASTPYRCDSLTCAPMIRARPARASESILIVSAARAGPLCLPATPRLEKQEPPASGETAEHRRLLIRRRRAIGLPRPAGSC